MTSTNVYSDADDLNGAQSLRTEATRDTRLSGESRAYGFGAAMTWVILLRAAIFGIGALSLATAAGRIGVGNESGHLWLAWDGEHYLHILKNGYAATMEDENFYKIAFFPLLPMMSRPLALFMPPAIALVVFANVCTLVGFAFLYLWARRLAGQRVALICVLLLATYPGSVFFSAALTEGPFFMLVALALWLMQQDRFWWAALVATVATLSRPTGVALAAIVPLYAWVRSAHVPVTARVGMFLGLGVLGCVGALGYEAFLWHRYDAPDAYVQAQGYWEYGDAMMIRDQEAAGVKRYSWRFFVDRLMQPQAWNRGIALVLVVVIGVGLFQPMKIPRVYFFLPLIIFLMTWLPNNGLRASSIVRYESAAVPLFLLAAMWLSDLPKRPVLGALLAAQLAMQIYYAVLFTRGVWVG